MPDVAYVLKRFPRLSETFILNEILALERAGRSVRVFAASHPGETVVHEGAKQVRAQVTYTRNALRGMEEGPEQLLQEAGISPEFYREVVAERKERGDQAGLREAAQAALIAACARREKIPHLHAHFATFAARAACLAAQLSGIPFSFTAHAKDIFLDSVDRTALAQLLRRAAFVVAISDYHRKFLSELAPEARIVVVRNGLDLESFACPDFSPASFFQRASLQILGVGRLVEKKSFGDLLRACALLRDQGVGFQCRLIGEGPERQMLEHLIERLELSGLCVLEGARPQEVVRERLSSASVLIAPCVELLSGDRDGMPTVILEAMAMGVPVVTTPVTAIPETIHDGETGRLVPERSPDEVAAAVLDLAFDPERTRSIAMAARGAVERHHDVRRSAATLAVMFGEANPCG